MKRPQSLGLIFVIYFVLISSPALATGDCSDYTDLTGMEFPIIVNGTTSGATGDYGPFAEEPSCWQGDWDASCAYGNDVTYKWTAPYDGAFTFTLFGSPSNADLLLFQFTCPAEPIYPGDFICGAHRTWMETATLWNVELAAGQEVLIVVDGWLVWNGDFTLRVDHETTTSDMVAMLMPTYYFCGASVASACGGTARYFDGIGLANVAEGVPINDEHMFSVASVSKPVTGTALMQLWEQGLFDLDDPVDLEGYLPFPVRNPNYPDVPITFRMVMSHVSSIDDRWSVINNLIQSDGNDSPVTPCELVEGYFTPGGEYYDPTNFINAVPGTVWEYTNIGATLLGCLVEYLNPDGLTFEDYCRAYIFDPLQMPLSSFLLANIDPENLATLHHWDGSQYLSYPHLTSPIYPAGHLRTNAEELSRFMLAFMHGGELYGERILEPATVDTMLAVHYPGVTSGFEQALVWRHNNIAGCEIWAHPGGWNGNCSRIHFSRDCDYGAIFIANSEDVFGTLGNFIISDQMVLWCEEDIPTGVGSPASPSLTPDVAQLAPNVPNPFNPQTEIRFELPSAGHVYLTIHDVRGQRVTTLLNEPVSAGLHSATWNGRYGDGREAPSGVYFSRLEVGDQVTHGKMTLVR